LSFKEQCLCNVILSELYMHQQCTEKPRQYDTCYLFSLRFYIVSYGPSILFIYNVNEIKKKLKKEEIYLIDFNCLL
jgi:hypothetical protein